MYIPKHFQESDDQEIIEFIKHHNFGVLVSMVDGKYEAVHLPFIVSETSPLRIEGHVSRGNKIRRVIENNDDVMLIVSGPHFYISPTAYDHENVPTWNYQAVHCYGTLRLLEGKDLVNSLKKLIDENEKVNASDFTMESLSEQFIKRELKGITGFTMEVDEIQAQYKLSQNRDKKNYEEVISSLEAKKSSSAKAVASAMRKLKR